MASRKTTRTRTMTEDRGFSIGMDNSKVLYDYVKTASQFLDEIGFDVSPDGLRVLQADRTMVCVVDFTLKAAALSSIDGSGKFAVNAKSLDDILKRFSGKPIIISRGKGKITVSCCGRTLGMDEIAGWDWTMPPVGKLDYKCGASVSGEWLCDAFKDADIAGECLRMEFGAGVLSMSAKGLGTVSYESELSVEGAGACNSGGTSIYPLEYLKRLELLRSFEKVRVDTEKDYPLRMTVEDDVAKFTFVLAPRVED